MTEERLEQLLKEKLANVNAPEDRSLVKEMVENGLLSVLRYNTDLIQSLEMRILDEIRQKVLPYDIFTTVVERDQYDSTHSYLRPVLEEDLEETVYDMDEIGHTALSRENITLFRIYMGCDYATIQTALNKTFAVKLITETDTITATAKLWPTQVYVDRIAQLHKHFMRNGLRWTTLHCPYFFKYLDVCLQPILLPADAVIKEIDVDFGEYAKFAQRDLIPLWNIDTLLVKSASFAEPIIDRATFQHTIPVRNLGIGNGYLVDSEAHEFEQVRRMEGELIVVSEQEHIKKWSIVRILAPKFMETEKMPYPIYNNTRKSGYARAMSDSGPLIVRTRAEIFRYVNAFDCDAVTLKSVDLVLDTRLEGSTYDANPFLADEIRIGAQSNTLKLTFHCGQSNLFIYDAMSFLTSEVAMLYPEFHCVGVLA